MRLCSLFNGTFVKLNFCWWFPHKKYCNTPKTRLDVGLSLIKPKTYEKKKLTGCKTHTVTQACCRTSVRTEKWNSASPPKCTRPYNVFSTLVYILTIHSNLLRIKICIGFIESFISMRSYHRAGSSGSDGSDNWSGRWWRFSYVLPNACSIQTDVFKSFLKFLSSYCQVIKNFKLNYFFNYIRF